VFHTQPTDNTLKNFERKSIWPAQRRLRDNNNNKKILIGLWITVCGNIKTSIAQPIYCIYALRVVIPTRTTFQKVVFVSTFYRRNDRSQKSGAVESRSSRKTPNFFIFKSWKFNTKLFTDFAVLSTKKKKKIIFNFDELSKYVLNDISYFVLYRNINCIVITIVFMLVCLEVFVSLVYVGGFYSLAGRTVQKAKQCAVDRDSNQCV
jgi:hypothetical protein